MSIKAPVKTLVIVVVLGLVAALALSPLPFADNTRIVNSVVIARPLDAVFDYVTTPANWPKWHPASLAVSGAAANHSLLTGEQVTEDFIVAGRKGRVVWRVVKRDAPRLLTIAGDVDGHDAGVITYALTPTSEGTRFEREFDYGSRNVLFSVLNRLSIRAQVEAESTRAVQNLKQVLEAQR